MTAITEWPGTRAQRVAERAADAWYSVRGNSDVDYAVGVIAALMLTDHGPGQDDPAKLLQAASDEFIAGLLEEIWTAFWVMRPDLAIRVRPIAGWVKGDPPGPDLVRALAHTARAAAKAGLLDLVYGGHLADVDLLGTVYTHTRSSSARQARGEFYSPPNLCDMMAAMILPGKDSLEPGQSIAEPSAGTGGMLRAAAKVIREHGRDPGEFTWVANDLSHTAVACLAVNAHLWGLGHQVIIGIADSLAEPDWPERAWQEQQDACAHRDELAKHARILALLRSLAIPEPAPAPDALPAAAEPAPPATPKRMPPLVNPIQLGLFADAAEEPAA